MILDQIHSLVQMKARESEVLRSHSADIEYCSKILVKAFTTGKRLYLCGNGGSCADADHIASEFIKDFRIKRKRHNSAERSAGIFQKLQEGLPAVSLSNMSTITAIANDMAYSLVYAQQLFVYGSKGDVLFLLSSSGNSPNMANAAYTARKMGIYTVGFTGKQKQNRLRTLCHYTVKFEGNTAAPVQEAYMQVLHAICEIVEASVFERG